MKTHFEIIVIGGGQAGLSMSYLLKERNIDYVVFEKNKIGDTWQNHRWDTFCLVTPNWQCNLPGYSYTGNDPYGFMLKDEIVAFLKSYATSFNPVIKEGTEVLSVTKNDLTDLFDIQTSRGMYTSRQVVVAVGNFHFGAFPAIAQKLPAGVYQVHSDEYKNPGKLPEGEVLVVGSGQAGAQIAEDIHLTGKKVHLCVGDAPRTARLYRGKDVVEWLDMMGYYDLSIDNHPDGEAVRNKTNHYVTGRDGGREIDLRKFALQGMKLYGTLDGIEEGCLKFKNDLKRNLDNADNASENIKKKIDQYILYNNIDAPIEPVYIPAWQPAEETLNLNLANSNITSVVWCIGYGYNFKWIQCGVLDDRGLPKHKRGVTEENGLYFLGLTWQNTWGSARFSGVGKDAVYLLEHITKRVKNAPPNVMAVSAL